MKHSNNILTLILIVTVAIATGSCNRNTIYTHFEPTAQDGWRRQDTLHFETKAMAEAGIYDNTLSLRTTQHYPFTDITMIVNRRVEPQGITRTDTVSMALIDHSGQIKGKGTQHYLYSTELSPMSLQQGDRLLTTVRHYMIKERLPGISDVGLTVTLRH